MSEIKRDLELEVNDLPLQGALSQFYVLIEGTLIKFIYALWPSDA